jgi:hypothetical protein
MKLLDKAEAWPMSLAPTNGALLGLNGKKNSTRKRYEATSVQRGVVKRKSFE